MFQGSSIHYVYCLFIQSCSVGSRWDQEGPGGPFLWFDIPSKISSQCEDYFMPYWDIAQIPGAVLRVSDCAGLYSVVYHSPHLPPHHFQECQNQPPVTKPVIIVQKSDFFLGICRLSFTRGILCFEFEVMSLTECDCVISWTVGLLWPDPSLCV